MDQTTQVLALRSQGLTPKEIARRLGLRPAAVSEIIRVGAAQSPSTTAGVVKGCWVSPGWSVGLGFARRPVEWCDVAAGDGQGLVQVLVARENRNGGLVASGCLVDVFCLGVKDTVGPKHLEPDRLREFVNGYFGAFDDRPLAVPVELGHFLIWGAIDYARKLGFEPNASFERVRDQIGPAPAEANPITFGQDGKPMFVAGPNDDEHAILSTLRRTVGEGKFDFIMPV